MYEVCRELLLLVYCIFIAEYIRGRMLEIGGELTVTITNLVSSFGTLCTCSVKKRATSDL